MIVWIAMPTNQVVLFALLMRLFEVRIMSGEGAKRFEDHGFKVLFWRRAGSGGGGPFDIRPCAWIAS